MADIVSRQHQHPCAGGPGRALSAQLSHGKPVDNADESGTDTDDEGRLIQQATATAKRTGSEISPEPSSGAGVATTAAAPPPAAPLLPRAAPTQLAPVTRLPAPNTAKGKPAPKRPAGSITLRTLLDAGFIMPGCKVLYVEYKGIITWADLSEEGSIVCDGQSFESPSAFSIRVKRKLNPERKADDGWKAVKYAGKLLEHFKEQYLRQQLAASGLGGSAVRGTTPTGSLGGGGGSSGVAPSPHSSTYPSPVQQGAGDTNRAKTYEDEPPLKRQRVDGAVEGTAGGGTGRPSLKIKLKLKPAAPAPARPEPLLPLPAPAVPILACSSYIGTSPGSEQAGAQPFRLLVSDMALIMMDFHAHCSAVEVGGMLAGSYDYERRTLTVSRAFPVLEVQQQHHHPVGARGGAGAARPTAAVEFDATDLARVREVIHNWGLQCIGSYRSHPAYAATPNTLDVLYAARAREELQDPNGMKPYVCAIVAPYDPALSSPSSAVSWFHVQCDKLRLLPATPPGGPQTASAPSSSLPGSLQPMALEVATVENATSHMDIMSLVSTQFHHTARTYAARPTRAPMGLPWRPAAVVSRSNGSRQPQTCLDKLVASVVSRLPDMFEGDLRITYGIMVRDMVQHEFAQMERRDVRAGRVSENGGVWCAGGNGGAGSLAAARSRRTPRSNGVLAGAVRFHSDEETEDDDEEVQLDDEETEDDHET